MPVSDVSNYGFFEIFLLIKTKLDELYINISKNKFWGKILLASKRFYCSENNRLF